MQSPPSRFHLDRFRADPGNWVFGLFYFCPADARVVVPKRIRGFGLTLNFARFLALPVLVLLLVICWMPLEPWLGASLERFGLLIKAAAFLGLLVAVNPLSSWLVAFSKRREKP